MYFSISPAIFQTFPGLTLGVISVHGINNTGASDEITSLLRSAEQNVRATLQSETLSQHPNIAVWRDAYRKFGAKAKDHPSSIEALCRRVLKGDELRHINLLVDIYNALSLKYLLPMGGEDLDATKGNIELTFASATESPALMLGDTEPKAPREGEVIYRDDVGAICRRWNWRETDRTKLTEATKNAVLVIEGLPPVDRTMVEVSMKELSRLVEKYCNGTINVATLGASHSFVEI